MSQTTYNSFHVNFLLCVAELLHTFEQEKKENICLSPMTKVPIPTENSKRDNTKMPPKCSIEKGLRTD